MENLSNNIANKIALELNIDNDKKEVIAYGTFALLHTLLSIFLTITLGYLFNVLIEAVVILFTGSILRKYSGGAHASLPANCTLIGVVVCIVQAVFISYAIDTWMNLNAFLVLLIIAFGWSYYILYRLAPVDSQSKPIKSEEKKKRMKKKSFVILIIYTIIAVFMLVLYIKLKKTKFLVYALSISGGITWQTFTLTKLGHLVLRKIDVLFSYIIKQIRGVKTL